MVDIAGNAISDRLRQLAFEKLGVGDRVQKKAGGETAGDEDVTTRPWRESSICPCEVHLVRAANSSGCKFRVHVWCLKDESDRTGTFVRELTGPTGHSFPWFNPSPGEAFCLDGTFYQALGKFQIFYDQTNTTLVFCRQIIGEKLPMKSAK